jgi:hypothetical protein
LQTITSITARTYQTCEQDHKTLLQVASSQYEAQSSKSHQPVLTSWTTNQIVCISNFLNLGRMVQLSNSTKETQEDIMPSIS